MWTVRMMIFNFYLWLLTYKKTSLHIQEVSLPEHGDKILLLICECDFPNKIQTFLIKEKEECKTDNGCTTLNEFIINT